MRFLADENCDFEVVRVLRAAGHDVLCVKDVAGGATDDVVIGVALAEVRVLITEDKDFGQLVFASSTDSPGVIYLRFPARSRNEIAAAVLSLVEREGTHLSKRFAVVQPGRVRLSPR
jgi:predicted nuclease of predicted toxin-antitoxin system